MPRPEALQTCLRLDPYRGERYSYFVGFNYNSMTDKEVFEMGLEHVLKHDPIRYVVKKKLVTYVIEDINGNPVESFFSELNANLKCQMLNAIYSLGYSLGCEAVMKTIFK